VTATDEMATIEVRDNAAAIRLTERFDTAKCGSTPFEGQPIEVPGPLTGASDGAQFMPQGSTVFAHPPWKAERQNPQTGAMEGGGTGVAYAEFTLDLPDVSGGIRFRSDVAMDKGAVGEGKTDGVLYSVAATAPDQPELHAEVLNATADPKLLDLDLTSLRDRKITLRLQVHPGPRKDPTFDWARWYSPRVEIERRERGVLGLANAPFLNPLSSGGAVDFSGSTTEGSFTMELPGTLILLKEPPRPVTLPLDLARTPFLTAFVAATGELLTNPLYACATPSEGMVGGVKRTGLFMRPPNQGITEVAYPIVLPAQAAKLHAFVGLRDGSKAEGCGFIVKVNGKQLAYEHKVPGQWSEINADLSPWAGKPVVLTLVTDSEGGYDFDWAMWAEVQVTRG